MAVRVVHQGWEDKEEAWVGACNKEDSVANKVAWEWVASKAVAWAADDVVAKAGWVVSRAAEAWEVWAVDDLADKAEWEVSRAAEAWAVDGPEDKVEWLVKEEVWAWVAEWAAVKEWVAWAEEGPECKAD